MNLEVGMYAYSKVSRDYGIGKIINIHTNGFAQQEVEIQNKDIKISTSYDCVIASHNLIDLIEIGDYVNGKEVTYVYPNLIKVDSTDIWEIHSCDIKSIVTKEQFELMKYEVKKDE